MRKHARWAHSSVSAILGGALPPSIDTGGRRLPQLDSEKEDEGLGGRWGLRSKKGRTVQDNPLILAFTKLRSDLRTCTGMLCCPLKSVELRQQMLTPRLQTDIKIFDTPSLLHPFLQVIRSSSTSASITSLSLIAVTKFLSYGIVSRESPRLPEAMQLLSAALTHCRFEASTTHSSHDEVVFLRILKLMESMISGPGGELLSDESVCHIMETGLGLVMETRFSVILQRAAEQSMVSMCQVVFERLKHLEIEADDLEEETKDDMEAVKIEPGVNGMPEAVDGPDTQANGRDSSLDVEPSKKSEEKVSSEDPNTSQLDLGQITVTDRPVPIKPYSLPSIKELFRSLVELLDPHDSNYTDSTYPLKKNPYLTMAY
jgi:brefeldin A-resistance guanine nucleotide exchange factor 1